jgi:hypothetical protein
MTTECSIVYARSVTDEEHTMRITSQGGPSREARMLKRALALDVGDANPLEYDSARVDRAASRSSASALRTLTIPTIEDMGPPSVQVSASTHATKSYSCGKIQPYCGPGVEAKDFPGNDAVAEKLLFAGIGCVRCSRVAGGGAAAGSARRVLARPRHATHRTRCRFSPRRARRGFG